MNKTTEKFIKELQEALQNDDTEYIKQLIYYLKFDYRIDKDKVEQFLNKNGFREKYNQIYNSIDKPEINKEEFIKIQIEDIFLDLILEWLESKKGKKVVDKITKRVLQEVKNSDEIMFKREVDRALGYIIKRKTIIQKSIPHFIKYLSDRGLI